MDLNQLTPEQRQAVMMQAQQEANQRVMADVSHVDSIDFLLRCLPISLVNTCQQRIDLITYHLFFFFNFFR